MDYLYDSWLEKKRFEREQARLGGKRVVSSFSVNEGDDFDEMFGGEENERDDNFGVSDNAKEMAKRYGVDVGADL
jgi:hypothetical protein